MPERAGRMLGTESMFYFGCLLQLVPAVSVRPGENADPEATEDSWPRIQPASNMAMMKLWCVAAPVEDANCRAFALFAEPRVGKA